MKFHPPTELAAVAADQGGVFTRQQVLELGGQQTVIDRLLRSSEWIRLGQGVYTSNPTPTFEQYCWAGVLLAGKEHAAVGGRAAGHLLGICRRPRQITIWGGSVQERTSGPWRFRRGKVRDSRGEPPRIRTEDAILEACAESPERKSLDILATALRTGLTIPARLQERLLDSPQLPKRKHVLSLLPDLSRGIQSTLEQLFLVHVEIPHAFPETRRQKSLRKGSFVDVLFEGFNMIVELDGRLGHDSPAGRFRDAHRDNLHSLAGYRTLRFGWLDVSLTPCLVASMVAEMLRQQGWEGPGDGNLMRRCNRCTPIQLAA